MSKEGHEKQFLQFLHEKNLLPKYLNIIEQIILCKVNHEFAKIYHIRILQIYLNRFATFRGLNPLLIVLRNQSPMFELKEELASYQKQSINQSATENQKLFRFISHSTAMQKLLIEKIKNRKETSSFLTIWQLIAGVAALNPQDFATLNKEEKEFKIMTLLNPQQKMFFLKKLFELISTPIWNASYYSERRINYVVLECIKKNFNSLLEFLLRLDIGSWYHQTDLLTEKDPENQHPLLACFDADNLQAFQFFLIHAEHLLAIYHRYTSAPTGSPPMTHAALQGKTAFIKLISMQKPEYLDQLNSSKNNIAHTILNPFLSPSYQDTNLREIISILIKYRPKLFSVKNTKQKTPKDLLPKQFLNNPLFTLQ